MPYNQEQYITSEQAKELFQTKQIEEQQGKNTYIERLNAELVNSQHIQDSKDKRLFTYDDSDSMKQVKDAQKKLLKVMFSNSMSTDVKKYRLQKKKLHSLYDSLIEKCTAYITSHKNPWSDSGKDRKAMVLNIREQAEADKVMLDYVADKLFENSNTDISWANVVAELRPINIKESEYKISTKSGAMNTVSVLEKDDETIFFKQEEINRSVADEIKKKYKSTPGISKCKKEVEDLMKLTKDSEYLNVVLAPLKNLPNDSIKDTIERLKGSFELYDKEWIFKGREKNLALVLDMIKDDIGSWMIREGIANEAKIVPNTSLDARNVATSRMAEILGISDIICSAENMRLQSADGKEKKGIGMEKAVGKSIAAIIEETKTPISKWQYTKEVIMQLTKLMVFDVLCGQVDRNSGNFIYEYEQRQNSKGETVTVIKKVTGIDNDMAFGKLTFEDINEYKDGLLKLPCIYNAKNNDFLIEHLDAYFYDKILMLDELDVAMSLAGTISNEEITAFIKRLKSLQKVLQEKTNIRTKPSDYTDDMATKNVKASANNMVSYIRSMNVYR